MLNGNYGSHSVSNICSCEIGILVFQHANLAGIGIHNRGKGGLKAGEMCAAFRIINVVAEAQHIFPEFIGKLKSSLHLDSFGLALQINRLMKCFCIVVQILDISHNPIRLMVRNVLRLFPAQILKTDGQLGI